MKKTFLLSIFLLAQLGLRAQVYETFYSDFDNMPPVPEWAQEREGDNGNYMWHLDNANPWSGTNSLYHDYPVGGTNLTDDWYICLREFSFTHGGQIDSIRHAFSGFGMPGAGDTVAIYLLVGSPDPSNATQKILIHDFRGANYVGGGNWNLTTDIDIPPTNGTCYLALRYSTVVNWLTVQFDNISISSLQFANVDEHEKYNTSLYPNPSNGNVNLKTDYPESIYLNIVDLSGKQIMKKPMYNGDYEDLKLAKGIYIFTLSTLNGIVIKSDKLVVY